MKVLIDTNVLLWWLNDDPRLGVQARSFIAEAKGELLVSVASLWEVSIKWGIGKIAERGSTVMRIVEESGFVVIGIEAAHLAMLEELKPIGDHNDPFDRLILVHAMSEGAMLMTSDRQMQAYGIRSYGKRIDR